MTSSQWQILLIVAAAIAFIFPSYELLFNKNEKGFKRISKVGWVVFWSMLVVAVISLGYTITLRNEGIADKKNADSTRAADKKDIMQNSSDEHKKIEKSIENLPDKLNPKGTTENPLLDVLVFSAQKNPVIIKQKDTLKFNVVVGSIGGLKVKDLRDSYVIMKHRLGVINITGSKWDSQINESIMLYNNVGHSLTINISLDVPFELTNDTLYIFFKVKYKNTYEEEQPPLRKIYRVTKNDIYGSQLQEPDRLVFDKIKLFLKDKNNW